MSGSSSQNFKKKAAKAGDSDILISVVVPTYNRAYFLSMALKSLREQKVNPQTFETIVVDNASTDSTASVVRSLIKQDCMQLRYVYEPEQGLSIARNAGARHSRGKYVAYMDDDAMADSNWISNIASCIEELGPDAIGGPIFPYYVDEKPHWFLDRYEIRQTTPQSRYLVNGEFFSGSNMIFRREVLDNLNGFNPDVGIKGDRRIQGDEADFIFRYYKQVNHPTIYYSQDVVVYHNVPSWKMNIWKQWKDSIRTGKRKLEALHLSPSLWLCLARLVKYVPLLVWDVLAGQYLRNRAVYPFRQNYMYEVMLLRTRIIASHASYLLNFRR